MFESIIATSYGGVSATESLGLAPSDVAVIETDGTIEQADSIKVAYDGAPATGLDIFRHPLDAAAAHPAITGAAARHRRPVRHLPPVPRRHELRRRPLRAPLPDRQRVREPVRLLRRPGEDHHSRAGGRGRRGAGQGTPCPQAHFDALAAGYGDAASVSHLSAAQRSVRRALLRLVRQRVEPGRQRHVRRRLGPADPPGQVRARRRRRGARPPLRARLGRALPARPAARMRRGRRPPGVDRRRGGHQVGHARRA